MQLWTDLLGGLLANLHIGKVTAFQVHSSQFPIVLVLVLENAA